MLNTLAEIRDSEFIPQDVEDILKKNKTISSNFILKEHAKKVPYLPEDIIFNILVKVEARHLQEKIRLVCKGWNRMISTSPFVSQNATRTKPKLFIQGIISLEPPRFNIKVMELEDYGLDYRLHNYRECRSVRIRSSCNGFLLLSNSRIKGILEVRNPVTNCGVTLPLCPSGCPHKSCGAVLGFDPLTKQYKVVHVYADLFGFEIFTIGCSEDAWKRVWGPWKDPHERPFSIDFDWTDPVLVNDRFLHWYVSSDEYIISMDISNEKFIRIRLPDCGKKIDRKKYSLIEVDGNLSLIHRVSNTQIDVWILEDFHGQAWFKKHSIVDSTIRYLKSSNPVPNFSRLVPLGSSRNGEVFMFKYESSGTDVRFYLYDTKHRAMKKSNLRIKNLQPIIPHRSTLYHWKTLDKP